MKVETTVVLSYETTGPSCETVGAMSGDFSADRRGQGRYSGTTGFCGYTSRETTGIL